MPIKNPQLRKKYQSNYKRKKPRIELGNVRNISFICFDGETVNDKYILLGSSEDYIYNKDGLSTKDVLYYLYRARDKRIKVGFAISYDVNFWVKDLTDEQIVRLFNSEEIEFDEFTLLYYPRKMFIIKKGFKQTTIYDIQSFFQASLLKIIEKMEIKLSKSESDILLKGKSNRAENFDKMNLEQIIYYNKVECIVTERICLKLSGILENSYISLNGKKINLLSKKFYGVGAVANKILKLIDLQKEFFETLDKEKPEIRPAIYSTYYGGRMEIFKIGTFQNVYKYDINSAYPDAISRLRKINKMEIKRRNFTGSKFNFIPGNIYLIEFDIQNGNNGIGILPVRKKSGYVLFPKRGLGWYFGMECKFLNEINSVFTVKKEIKIEYGELLFSDNFIQNVYSKRQELKRAGDISEIAYKLILNSLYGKLAQTVGNKKVNIFHASFITSFCRAKILETIINNKAELDIIQISTDGIFLNRELKNISISKNLGDFSLEKYSNGIIIGSGVYKLWNRDKSQVAMRGFYVEEKIFNKLFKELLKKGSAIVSYNVFIGHKLAIAMPFAFGPYRLKFTEIEKTMKVFSYEKRAFENKKDLKKSINSFIIDIYNGGPVEISETLKKLKIDLIEETINESEIL